MKNGQSRKSLLDGYRFPGFKAHARIKGCFGDPLALVITLSRRQKKRSAGYAERLTGLSTTSDPGRRAISARAGAECTSNLISAESTARHVWP